MSIPAFIHTDNAQKRINKIIDGIKSGIPILLEGPTGTSKTKSAQMACEQINQKCIILNFSSQTKIEDLLGQMTKCSDEFGGFAFKKGPFAEAYEKGYCLILDEINLAHEQVLQSIEASLDLGFLSFDFPGISTEKIKMNPNFHLIATQNPLTGRFSQKRQFLSEKFLSRFQIINFSDITKEELLEIAYGLANNRINPELVQRIVDFHFAFAKKYNDDIHVFTIREIASTINSILKGNTPYESIQFYYCDQFDSSKANQIKNSLRKYHIAEITKSKLDFNINTDYFPTSILRQILNHAKKVLEEFHPVLLIGPDGCGKTNIARWIGASIQAPSKSTKLFVCNQEMTISDIIGRYMPVSLSNEEKQESSVPVRWKNGPVIDAMINGHVLILDQIDTAPSTILERLNSLYDGMGIKDFVFTVQENPEESEVVVHESFRIIATASDEGLKDLSPAFLNRFTIIYVNNQMEEIYNERKIPDLVNFIGRQMNSISLSFLINILANEQRYNISQFTKIVRGYCKLKKNFPTADDNDVIDFLLSIVNNNTQKSYQPKIKNKFAEILLKSLDVKVDEKNDPFYFNKASSTRSIMATLVACSVINQHIIMIGKTGLGKTAAAMAFANMTKISQSLQMISFNGETQLEELFGYFTIEKGDFSLHMGPLGSAMEDGHVFIADELNIADQQIVQSLNVAVEPLPNETIIIPVVGKDIKVHQGFMFIGCQNDITMYGRRPLPDSFKIKVLLIDYPEPSHDDLLNLTRDISAPFRIKEEDADKTTTLIEKIQDNHMLKMKPWSLREVRKLYRRTEFTNKTNIIKGMTIWHHAAFMLKSSFKESAKLIEEIVDIVSTSFQLSLQQKNNLLEDINADVKVNQINENSISISKRSLTVILYNTALLGIPESLQSFWKVLFESSISHFAEPLLFVGPSGFKTFLAKQLLPLSPVAYLHNDSTTSSLIGQIILLDKYHAKLFLLDSLKIFDSFNPQFSKKFEYIRSSIEQNELKQSDINELVDALKVSSPDAFASVIQNLASNLLLLDQNVHTNSMFANYTSVFKPGLVTKAILQQNSLILKNIAQPSPSVLERFNELLSVSPSLTLFEDTSNTFTTEQTRKLVNFSQRFRIIGICLPHEKHGLSDAMLSRLTEICVPSYSEQEQNDVYGAIMENEDRYQASNFNTMINTASEIFKNLFDITIPFALSIEIAKITVQWSKIFDQTDLSLLFAFALFRCAGGLLLTTIEQKAQLIKKLSNSSLSLPNEFLTMFLNRLKPAASNCQSTPNLEIIKHEISQTLRSTVSNFSVETNELHLPNSNLLFTPSMSDLIDLIISMASIMHPLIIEGPNGCGKSSAVSYVADCVGAKVITLSLSQNTTIEDLFGKVEQTGDSETIKFEFRETQFLHAIKADRDDSHITYWIVIEEMHLASAAVLDSLGAIFDSDATEFLLPTGETVNKGHYFIIGLMSKPISHQSLINTALYYKTANYTSVEFNEICTFVLKNENFKEEAKTFCEKIQILNNIVSTSQNRIPVTVREADKFIKMMKSSQNLLNTNHLLEMLFLGRFSDEATKTNAKDDMGFEDKFSIPYIRIQNNASILNAGDVKLKINKDSKDSRYDTSIRSLTCSQRQLFQFMALSILGKIPLIVQGPTASGKTYIINLLANIVNHSIRVIQLNSESTSASLAGNYQPSKNLNEKDAENLQQCFNELLKIHELPAEIRNKLAKQNIKAWKPTDFHDLRKQLNDIHLQSSIRSIIEKTINSIDSALQPIKYLRTRTDSAIVQALVNGDWLLLDGIEAAPADLFDRLFTLLEDRPTLNLYERSKGYIYSLDSPNPKLRISPEFRLFMTYNPVNRKSTNNISPAFLSRCAIFTLDPIDSTIIDSSLLLDGLLYNIRFQLSPNNTDCAVRLAKVHNKAKNLIQDQTIFYTGRSLVYLSKALSYEYINNGKISNETLKRIIKTHYCASSDALMNSEDFINEITKPLKKNSKKILDKLNDVRETSSKYCIAMENMISDFSASVEKQKMTDFPFRDFMFNLPKLQLKDVQSIVNKFEVMAKSINEGDLICKLTPKQQMHLSSINTLNEIMQQIRESFETVKNNPSFENMMIGAEELEIQEKFKDISNRINLLFYIVQNRYFIPYIPDILLSEEYAEKLSTLFELIQNDHPMFEIAKGFLLIEDLDQNLFNANSEFYELLHILLDFKKHGFLIYIRPKKAKLKDNNYILFVHNQDKTLCVSLKVVQNQEDVYRQNTAMNGFPLLCLIDILKQIYMKCCKDSQFQITPQFDEKLYQQVIPKLELNLENLWAAADEELGIRPINQICSCLFTKDNYPQHFFSGLMKTFYLIAYQLISLNDLDNSTSFISWMNNFFLQFSKVKSFFVPVPMLLNEIKTFLKNERSLKVIEQVQLCLSQFPYKIFSILEKNNEEKEDEVAIEKEMKDILDNLRIVVSEVNEQLTNDQINEIKDQKQREIKRKFLRLQNEIQEKISRNHEIAQPLQNLLNILDCIQQTDEGYDKIRKIIKSLQTNQPDIQKVQDFQWPNQNEAATITTPRDFFILKLLLEFSDEIMQIKHIFNNPTWMSLCQIQMPKQALVEFIQTNKVSDSIEQNLQNLIRAKFIYTLYKNNGKKYLELNALNQYFNDFNDRFTEIDNGWNKIVQDLAKKYPSDYAIQLPIYKPIDLLTLLVNPIDQSPGPIFENEEISQDLLMEFDNLRQVKYKKFIYIFTAIKNKYVEIVTPSIKSSGKQFDTNKPLKELVDFLHSLLPNISESYIIFGEKLIALNEIYDKISIPDSNYLLSDDLNIRSKDYIDLNPAGYFYLSLFPKAQEYLKPFIGFNKKTEFPLSLIGFRVMSRAKCIQIQLPLTFRTDKISKIVYDELSEYFHKRKNLDSKQKAKNSNFHNVMGLLMENPPNNIETNYTGHFRSALIKVMTKFSNDDFLFNKVEDKICMLLPHVIQTMLSDKWEILMKQPFKQSNNNQDINYQILKFMRNPWELIITQIEKDGNQQIDDAFSQLNDFCEMSRKSIELTFSEDKSQEIIKCVKNDEQELYKASSSELMKFTKMLEEADSSLKEKLDKYWTAYNANLINIMRKIPLYTNKIDRMPYDNVYPKLLDFWKYIEHAYLLPSTVVQTILVIKPKDEKNKSISCTVIKTKTKASKTIKGQLNQPITMLRLDDSASKDQYEIKFDKNTNAELIEVKYDPRFQPIKQFKFTTMEENYRQFEATSKEIQKDQNNNTASNLRISDNSVVFNDLDVNAFCDSLRSSRTKWIDLLKNIQKMISSKGNFEEIQMKLTSIKDDIFRLRPLLTPKYKETTFKQPMSTILAIKVLNNMLTSLEVSVDNTQTEITSDLISMQQLMSASDSIFAATKKDIESINKNLTPLINSQIDANNTRAFEKLHTLHELLSPSILIDEKTKLALINIDNINLEVGPVMIGLYLEPLQIQFINFIPADREFECIFEPTGNNQDLPMPKTEIKVGTFIISIPIDEIRLNTSKPVGIHFEGNAHFKFSNSTKDFAVLQYSITIHFIPTILLIEASNHHFATKKGEAKIVKYFAIEQTTFDIISATKEKGTKNPIVFNIQLIEDIDNTAKTPSAISILGKSSITFPETKENENTFSAFLKLNYSNQIAPTIHLTTNIYSKPTFYGIYDDYKQEFVMENATICVGSAERKVYILFSFFNSENKPVTGNVKQQIQCYSSNISFKSDPTPLLVFNQSFKCILIEFSVIPKTNLKRDEIYGNIKLSYNGLTRRLSFQIKPQTVQVSRYNESINVQYDTHFPISYLTNINNKFQFINASKDEVIAAKNKESYQLVVSPFSYGYYSSNGENSIVLYYPNGSLYNVLSNRITFSDLFNVLCIDENMNAYWSKETTCYNDDDHIIKLFAVLKTNRNIIFPLIGKNRYLKENPFPEDSILSIPEYLGIFRLFLSSEEKLERSNCSTLYDYFRKPMTSNANFAYVIDFFGRSPNQINVTKILNRLDYMLHTNFSIQFKILVDNKYYVRNDRQMYFIFFIELMYQILCKYCDHFIAMNNHIYLPCPLQQIEEEQKRLIAVAQLDEAGIKNHSKIYSQCNNLMETNEVEKSVSEELERDGYKISNFVKWTADGGFVSASKRDANACESPAVINQMMKFNKSTQLLANIEMPIIKPDSSISEIFHNFEAYQKAALQYNFALYSAKSSEKSALVNDLKLTLLQLYQILQWTENNISTKYSIFDTFRADFKESFNRIYHGLSRAGAEIAWMKRNKQEDSENLGGFITLPKQSSVLVAPPNFQQIGLQQTETVKNDTQISKKELEDDKELNIDHLANIDESENEEEEEEDVGEEAVTKNKRKIQIGDLEYDDKQYNEINKLRQKTKKKLGQGNEFATSLVDSDEGTEMTDQDLIKTLIDQIINETTEELEFSDNIEAITYESLIPHEYDNINKDIDLTINEIFEMATPLTEAFLNCLNQNDEILNVVDDVYASILIECTTTMDYRQKASLIVFSIAYANALTQLHIPYSLMIFGDEEFHFLLKKLDEKHDTIHFQRLLDVINIRRRFTSLHEAIYLAEEHIKHPTRHNHVILTLSDGLSGTFHLIDDWTVNCFNNPKIAISFFFMDILKSINRTDENEDEDNGYSSVIEAWNQFEANVKQSTVTPVTVFYEECQQILTDPSIIVNKFIEIIQKFPENPIKKEIKELTKFVPAQVDSQLFYKYAVQSFFESFENIKSDVFVNINEDLEINDSLDFEPPFASNETYCAKFIGYQKAFMKLVLDESPHFFENSSVLDLNSYLFVPNKPSQYSPSSNGTIFYFPGLVKFLLTNGQDTKIFLDKKAGLINSYSVFIVVDCTSSSFPYAINKSAYAHAVQSVFSLLTTLSRIDLPSITIIVTTNEGPVLLCNGESTFSILSNSSSIWAALFYLLMNPHNENHIVSALSSVLTIRMQQKTVSSVCFIFSDGNYSIKTRGTVAELSNSIETYKASIISIGIGNEPKNATKLARKSVWSPNPKYLVKGIASLFEKENPDILHEITTFLKPTDINLIDAINKIASFIHKSTELPFDSLHKELDKVIRRFKAFRNFYNAQQEGIENATANPEGNQYDLGKSNTYQDQSVLFCMFWDACLARSESPDITVDVLKHGLPGNYGVSAVNGLQDLGMNVQIVQDYEKGIKEMATGKHSQVHIICGRNDGRLPNGGDPNLVYHFIQCCIKYWKNGGGLVFWTDNEPFVYELNLFLKEAEFYNFGKSELRVGGNDLGNGTLKAGSIANLHLARCVFNDERTIQCEGYERALFNFNLVSMYEGITVAHAIDTTKMEPFKPFAVSSQGGVSAMYYSSSLLDSTEGDIVIDCGFSKLFREISEEGISRYIRNIAVWMLSIEKKEMKYGNEIDPLKYHPPQFEFNYPKSFKWKFDCFNTDNAIDLVFLIDGTKSMDPYIDSVAKNCTNVAKYCKQKASNNNFSYACVIFRDFAFARWNKMGENRNKNEVIRFTKKIKDIESFLSGVDAFGGGGDGPEDWVSAYKDLLSLHWREKSAKIVIHITDSGTHGTQFCGFDNAWDEEGDRDLPPLIEEAAKRKIMFHCIAGHRNAVRSFQTAKNIYNRAGGLSFKIENMEDGAANQASLHKTILRVIQESIDDAIAVPQ